MSRWDRNPPEGRLPLTCAGVPCGCGHEADRGLFTCWLQLQKHGQVSSNSGVRCECHLKSHQKWDRGARQPQTTGDKAWWSPLVALIYVTADTVREPEEVTCCAGGGVTLPAFGGVQQHQPNGQWGQRELGASLGPPPPYLDPHQPSGLLRAEGIYQPCPAHVTPRHQPCAFVLGQGMTGGFTECSLLPCDSSDTLAISGAWVVIPKWMVHKTTTGRDPGKSHGCFCSYR